MSVPTVEEVVSKMDQGVVKSLIYLLESLTQEELSAVLDTNQSDEQKATLVEMWYDEVDDEDAVEDEDSDAISPPINKEDL